MGELNSGPLDFNFSTLIIKVLCDIASVMSETINNKYLEQKVLQ